MKKIKLLIIFFVSLFVVLQQANANIAVSPLKYELEVEQGTTVTKKIKVTNEGEEPITLYTSAEDFIAGDSTGKPKFVKPEEQENPEISLSNWVNIKEKNITLDSGETREIEFDVSVPKNGEPGGHYGAVFFATGIQGNGQIASSQRIGILLLIEVPGELKISGNIEEFDIGTIQNETFEINNTFTNLPVIFNTKFVNSGNIHLKPKGKIELVDENGETLKNIGKEVMVSPTGAFIGEKMVDYIPVNDIDGVTLPHSERNYIAEWQGFGYTVLNEDGTKEVLFKGLNEYYEDKAAEKQAYLMFWEQIKTKRVKKEIKANYNIFYEAKDKEKKEFINSKSFEIEYDQKYIGLNYYIIGGASSFLLLILGFVIIYLPKRKKKAEEKLRKKIIEEMKNNQK